MTGDSILIRRKDVIAGKGIAIEPSGVSAAIRIINTEVDSERLLPVNPTVNDIPIYKQMDAEGNGEDVKLLIQSPATASQVADTAAGVVTHATVTAHGSLGVDDHGLLFDGNTYLEIDKNNVQSILTGSNPWCFDLYIIGSEEVTSSYVQIGSLFTDNNDYVINWGMIDGKVNAVNIPAWGTIEGFTAGEPHLLTIEHYINAGASTIALYCDNVRRSVISNVILPTVNENLWIGKGPVGYFKGWLDYIRIRNTAPYQSSTITPDPTPYLAAGERWTVINLSEIEGGGGTTPTDVDWNDIQNKPSTFPPSAHTHIISDVTGLSDVAVKAHTHENKTTLDKFGEVNNKPTFNGEEIGSGVSSWNDLEDKPTTFPPSEHTHQIADVSGLQDSLDSKVSSVNGQTGTVTIPNATATEAGLMSAADKSKLDGIDTTGSTGDMLKSVYDTDDDGIVDHAATADAVGATTAAQVADAVGKAHTHANKATLDKLAETDGKLTFDGAEIGGGSGTVKSVNGQLPDESGNVTVETGGAVNESRLLPENPADGDIPCFDATATVGGGNDAHTKILLHFDADEIKDEAAGNAAPVTITKKTGTITVVEGGKWGKCAKYVTGSMTVATNLDELNANNWVVSGWFNPDENKHGVSYPTWLSMDDQNTHGFGFDSTGRYGESDGPLFYLDTPPASGTWHWLAIVKYSGGLRFYLNGAFLNEISAQQRANFCSTLAIGGFAGTYAAGSTERTFNGLVDEVRLQYIPDDEITQWTGTSIAVPDAPYSKPQTVGEWGKLNKSELKATRVRILSRDPSTRLAVVQPLRLRNGVWETDPDAPEKTVKY